LGGRIVNLSELSEVADSGLLSHRQNIFGCRVGTERGLRVVGVVAGGGRKNVQNQGSVG